MAELSPPSPPPASPPIESLSGSIDRLARGSALGALLLLTVALLALGFSSHRSSAPMALTAPTFDIETTAPEHVAPNVEVP